MFTGNYASSCYTVYVCACVWVGGCGTVCVDTGTSSVYICGVRLTQHIYSDGYISVVMMFANTPLWLTVSTSQSPHSSKRKFIHAYTSEVEDKYICFRGKTIHQLIIVILTNSNHLHQ